MKRVNILNPERETTEINLLGFGKIIIHKAEDKIGNYSLVDGIEIDLRPNNHNKVWSDDPKRMSINGGGGVTWHRKVISPEEKVIKN